MAQTHYAAPGGVQAALGKAAPGDTVLLQDGDHGDLVIQYAQFEADVIVRPKNRGKVHANKVVVKDCSHLDIRGLRVWPNDPKVHGATLVEAYGSASHHLTFRGLDVRTALQAWGYAKWTADIWAERMVNGFASEAPNTKVFRSRFLGVRFGIMLTAANSLAEGNTVAGFSGDGLRAGTGTAWRKNVVRDAVSIDENHADGLQAYGGPDGVSDLIIDGNEITEWASTVMSPLKATLQGIGLFDGFYDNLLIANNKVKVSAGHGITVLGAHNAVIADNIVTPMVLVGAKYPWVMLGNHKDGRASTDCRVTGNKAIAPFGQSDPANQIVYENNTGL